MSRKKSEYLFIRGIIYSFFANIVSCVYRYQMTCQTLKGQFDNGVLNKTPKASICSLRMFPFILDKYSKKLTSTMRKYL